MSRPGIEPGPPKWQDRQLVNCYSEHLIMSSRHGSPQCMCYMNILEHTWTALGRWPNSTCKVDGLLPGRHLASPSVSGSPLQRELTRHLYPNLRSQDWDVPARNWTWASREGSEHSRKEPSRQHVNCYLEHLHMSPRQVSWLKTFIAVSHDIGRVQWEYVSLTWAWLSLCHVTSDSPEFQTGPMRI